MPFTDVLSAVIPQKWINQNKSSPSVVKLNLSFKSVVCRFIQTLFLFVFSYTGTCYCDKQLD